jgi:putative membrane protein
MFFRSHVLAFALTTALTGWGWAQVQQQQQQQQPGYPRPVPDSGPANPGGNPGAVPPLINSPDQQPADPMASDKRFVKDAAEANATQVELGKLAQQKGSSDAVKEFGKRMVEAHTEANEELKQAATKANIQVPTEPPRKVKKTGDKLAKLSGPDFDRAYARIVVNEHKDDVKAFAREAQGGKATEVREFASRTLPKLQEHRKLAEQLDAGAKSSSPAK